jgi:hypothetical protein
MIILLIYFCILKVLNVDLGGKFELGMKPNPTWNLFKVILSQKENLHLKKMLTQRQWEHVCITKYARLYNLSNGIMVMTPIKNGFFPFHREIMWTRLVKIQYTELKLSNGNNPVVKHSIYSNGDLWPNDPKKNKVLPLPHGNHVAKFGKDPIYRTKVIVRKPVWTPARHTQSHNTESDR